MNNFLPVLHRDITVKQLSSVRASFHLEEQLSRKDNGHSMQIHYEITIGDSAVESLQKGLPDGLNDNLDDAQAFTAEVELQGKSYAGLIAFGLGEMVADLVVTESAIRLSSHAHFAVSSPIFTIAEALKGTDLEIEIQCDSFTFASSALDCLMQCARDISDTSIVTNELGMSFGSYLNQFDIEDDDFYPTLYSTLTESEEWLYSTQLTPVLQMPDMPMVCDIPRRYVMTLHLSRNSMGKVTTAIGVTTTSIE